MLVNRDAAVRGETFNPHASVLVQGLSPSRRALEKALEAVATPRTPGAPLPLPLRSSNIHSRNLEISAALGSRDASSFYLPVAMTPDKVSAPVRGAQTAPQRSPLAASAVQNSARFECVTGRSKTPTKTPQSKLSASSAANPGASSVVRSSTAPVSDGAAQGCKAPQWVRVRGSLDRSNLPIVAVPCTPQQPSLESQHSADSPRRRLASRSPQPRAEADRLDDSVSRPKVGAASTARPQPSAQVHLSARRSVKTTPDHLQVPSGSERESKLSRETPVADLPSALRLSAVDSIKHALEAADALNDDLRDRLMSLLEDLKTPVLAPANPKTIAAVEVPIAQPWEEAVGATSVGSGQSATLLARRLGGPPPQVGTTDPDKLRGHSLSFARDQFKKSVRAPERSDEFHASLLRELEAVKAGCEA